MALYDINGKLITSGGSGNSHFTEVEAIPNGLQIPEVPSDFTTNENWKYSENSGNLATVIGGARYLYLGRMFTGRVYVRYTTTTPNVQNPVKMHLVASDYIDNQTADGETLTPTLETIQFNGQYVFVSENGTASTMQTSGTNPDGYPRTVRLVQYDIPEGRYAVLSSSGKGTGNGSNAYVPEWFTVFTTDPKDNITQIPDGSALNSVKANNLEGFGKGTAENEYFLKYFKEQADKATPKYYKPQTFGKSLYVVGDSLHAYAGGNGFESDGFISDYNKYLGFKQVVNNSWAGQTMSGTSAGGVYYAKQAIEAGIPYDVFIFAHGSNNDTNGLGELEDEASDTALTLVGGMKWIIENIRKTFPKSAIGFMTPPPSSNKDNSPAREMVKAVCELENVSYCDAYYYVSVSDLSDGSHFAESGSAKYGSGEAKLILDICPYGEPLQ